MSALTDLITRVEAATGPDIHLDAAIAAHFGQPQRIDYFTSSIDAVVALIRREMPGASYGFTREPPSAVFARVTMAYGASGDADHITEALALLLAFLRAKVQQDA